MSPILRTCGRCGQVLGERVSLGDRCPRCGARLASVKDVTPRGSGSTPWWMVAVAFGLLAVVLMIGALGSRRPEEAAPDPSASTVERYHRHVAALRAIAEQDAGDPDRAVSRIDSYCRSNAGELTEIAAGLEQALRRQNLDVGRETWPMLTLCGKVRALDERATIVKLSGESRAALDALALKRTGP